MSRVESRESRAKVRRQNVSGSRPSSLDPRPSERAFTMVEIAICLAIIGVALVAIIGDLPIGMNVQKDNREQTVINQDATIFIEAIRSGSRGADDLTNYVYAITNYQTPYAAGIQGLTVSYGWSTASATLANGAQIVGLLSTPKYQANGPGSFTLPNAALPNLINNSGYSNHVIAYVRSMSGPAVEKPPQDNQLLQQDSFGYHIICENVPLQTDPNSTSPYNSQMGFNLHELRLTFRYPTLPNGGIGNQPPQTYRTLIAGQYMPDTNGLFFYQPQSFLINTNPPPPPP